MNRKPDEVLHFGVINEDDFSLSSPRAIDGDECKYLSEAFAQAEELMSGGAQQVSIVIARYSAKHEAWVEVSGRSLTIEAHNWADEEED